MGKDPLKGWRWVLWAIFGYSFGLYNHIKILVMIAAKTDVATPKTKPKNLSFQRSRRSKRPSSLYFTPL